MSRLRRRMADAAERRTTERWRERLTTEGVPRAWPELAREAKDPVAALRIASQATGRIWVGQEVDPMAIGQPEAGRVAEAAAMEPGETSVWVAPMLSAVVLGKPESGKNTTALENWLMQDLAAERQLLLVTPQDVTVNRIAALAKALTGGGEIPILDFSLRMVDPPGKGLASPLFLTWDPTLGCDDPDKAYAVAKAFTGKGTQFRKDLGEGGDYWGQWVTKLFAAAGHLVAHERELERKRSPADRGLSRDHANGIDAVLEYFTPAEPEHLGAHLVDGVRTHREIGQALLTDSERAVLASDGVDVGRYEVALGKAAAYAADFHPDIAQVAFDGALLSAQGCDVSEDILYTRLKKLNKEIYDFETDKGSTPLTHLQEAATEPVPRPSRRVLSPTFEDQEITPQQVAHSGDGLVILTYSEEKDPGIALGIFVKAVIEEAMNHRADERIRAYEGRGEMPREMKVYLDECKGLKHMKDAINAVFTNGRQAALGAVVASTSKAQLVEDGGEACAKTLLTSTPILLNLTPDAEEVESLAKLFGTYWREQVDETHPRGPGALPSETVKYEEVDKVKPGELVDLKRGQAVYFGPSSSGSRYKIVQLPHPTDPGTPVADAARHVAELGLPGAPWAQMRPSLFVEPPAQGRPGQPGSPAPQSPPVARGAGQAIPIAEPAVSSGGPPRPAELEEASPAFRHEAPPAPAAAGAPRPPIAIDRPRSGDVAFPAGQNGPEAAPKPSEASEVPRAPVQDPTPRQAPTPPSRAARGQRPRPGQPPEPGSPSF